MLMSDRPAVEEWWKQKRAHGTGAASQRCLVTGRTAPAASKHPKIEALPGGNTSGTALVSFNSSAFESYGWKVFENAQVSNEAAEACATALNRLISAHPVDPQNSAQTLPRRNIRLPGDTVVCYWSRESAQGSFLDCLAGLLEADEASVAELYRSVWRGRPVELDPAPFYALTISGAQGRAVVRGWLETTLQEVGRHLARHFQDFNLDSAKKGEHPPAIPLARLLAALGVRGDKEKTPPSLSVEIFQAALRGTLYPLGALQRAIERTRMEPKHDEPGKNGPKYTELLEYRTAIIKACINRRWRIQAAPTDRKELDASMDPTCSSPGYQLGLLMAVLERLQQAALGDNVNATLIDRFFAGASASPRAVFMRLLKTSVFHARKAADESKTRGLAFRLERLKEAILDRFSPLSGGIPNSLDLENQGLFILGYYQMRRWLWLGADERRTWEAEHPSAPGAFVWAKAGNGPEQNSDIQQGDTHAQ
jgi:CRISPR-associated protein Csd1